MAKYDQDLLRRAAAYLFLKETPSSFEVEREKPSPQKAQRFADLLRQLARYNQIDPATLHRGWLRHLPERPGLACDIGPGSGRDANWLAEKGWDVIAVEPEAALREQARQHSHPNVAWLDDRLPDLARLQRLNQRFNLILLSAVLSAQ